MTRFLGVPSYRERKPKHVVEKVTRTSLAVVCDSLVSLEGAPFGNEVSVSPPAPITCLGVSWQRQYQVVSPNLRAFTRRLC